MYSIQAKAYYSARFDGSAALFSTCWRKYRKLIAEGYDDPTCDEDVDSFLDALASEQVNDSNTRFYIYG